MEILKYCLHRIPRYDFFCGVLRQYFNLIICITDLSFDHRLVPHILKIVKKTVKTNRGFSLNYKARISRKNIDNGRRRYSGDTEGPVESKGKRVRHSSGCDEIILSTNNVEVEELYILPSRPRQGIILWLGLSDIIIVM